MATKQQVLDWLAKGSKDQLGSIFGIPLSEFQTREELILIINWFASEVDRIRAEPRRFI